MQSLKAAHKPNGRRFPPHSLFHRLPRAWLLLGLALFASSLLLSASRVKGEAVQAPAKASPEWVAEQIAKLDADTLQERTQAERALLEAGPKVLPLLPAPELLPSDAVRQAVRRIRLRLEEAKARDSVKASTVTIEGKLPLKDILKQIVEQTGNPLDFSQLPKELLNKTWDVSFRNISFWEAMGLLAKEFRLSYESPTATNRAGQILRIPQEPRIKNWKTHQAFLMEWSSPELRPRFGAMDRQLLRVPIQLAAEPRLRPLFLKVEGKDFSARAGENAKLSPFNPDAKLELPLGEAGSEISFDMDFDVPKPFEVEAIQLHGKVTMTVAAGSEQFTFSDLSKASGSAKRRGGVTVTLNEIEFQPDRKNPNRNAARFRITVHYDTGGPAFESHRTWMFHNEVYLEDAQGQKLQQTGEFHTALQTDGGVTVEYNFENLRGDAGEYKFTYIAPTLIINVPVELTLKNLPVPKLP